MENTRFSCNSLWVFRYESVKINYVSKGKPWDYEFLWFCAFVFCGNLLQPCFILWIDINCKWDLHNKRALDNITNWVNVIASLKWWEDALRCIYYYYRSWAHCLSPFSFLMTSTEFERQTLLPLETFNLLNCFSFFLLLMFRAEIIRCDTVCRLYWYWFRSHWDYCQDTYVLRDNFINFACRNCIRIVYAVCFVLFNADG